MLTFLPPAAEETAAMGMEGVESVAARAAGGRKAAARVEVGRWWRGWWR